MKKPTITVNQLLQIILHNEDTWLLLVLQSAYDYLYSTSSWYCYYEQQLQVIEILHFSRKYHTTG